MARPRVREAQPCQQPDPLAHRSWELGGPLPGVCVPSCRFGGKGWAPEGISDIFPRGYVLVQSAKEKRRAAGFQGPMGLSKNAQLRRRGQRRGLRRAPALLGSDCRRSTRTAAPPAGVSNRDGNSDGDMCRVPGTSL